MSWNLCKQPPLLATAPSGGLGPYPVPNRGPTPTVCLLPSSGGGLAGVPDENGSMPLSGSVTFRSIDATAGGSGDSTVLEPGLWSLTVRGDLLGKVGGQVRDAVAQAAAAYYAKAYAAAVAAEAVAAYELETLQVPVAP